MSPPLLELDRLTIELAGVPVVNQVSLAIHAGETFALLGESGSGKSMTALAIMGLLPVMARWRTGDIRLAGQSLARLDQATLRGLRGGQMGMIFQEPMTSLNPVMTVGKQILEGFQLHRGMRRTEARQAAAGLLQQVGVPDPVRRLDEFPFQLSGGLKQRVMIALSLSGNPQLLIADEPTTALDVTVQAQVLALLREEQRKRDMGLLLITHDLGVAWSMADQIGILYAGQLVELAGRDALFSSPAHPYTRKLLAALPKAGQQRLASIPGGVAPAGLPGCPFVSRCELAMPRCHTDMPDWTALADSHQVRCHAIGMTEKPVVLQAVKPPVVGDDLLTISGVKVHFPMRNQPLWQVRKMLKAVDGIDLVLRTGEAVALVGESGCGKTTLARAVAGLQGVSAGEVVWSGTSATGRNDLRRAQMVFQDPFSSLDPRMRVDELIGEGMQALGVDASPDVRQRRLDQLMQQVGLTPDALARYPHQFSGGQRQRIAIARALAVRPALLVCDEPTSALDVSVQAQIVNLLADIQRDAGVSLLFVTHNLPLAAYLAQRVLVMYLGRIVESGPAEALVRQPAHPYSRVLLDAVPEIGKPAGTPAIGEAASAVDPPAGCHFHPRCGHVQPVCRTEPPLLRELGQGRQVRCHFPLIELANG